MLFDSHTHLDDQQFDKDRHEVIQRAFDNGISYIVNPGADLASSEAAIELADQYENLYAAVGVHPHAAKEFSDDQLQRIEALASHKKVVAIGEIGLDYHYDFSKKEEQKPCFRKQLQLAKKLKLPVIIHDREAHQDVFDILVEEKSFETGVLMHCFSGSKELMELYIEQGAYISLGGPVTFKNAKKPVEVAKAVPLDRLLIETDSPYLTPTPFRGKRNESTYVRHVAEKIASIRALSFQEVASRTTENAKRFFSIGG